jgi:hypothetical protein
VTMGYKIFTSALRAAVPNAFFGAPVLPDVTAHTLPGASRILGPAPSEYQRVFDGGV